MSSPQAAEPVSLKEALRFWLKLGFISFGGPAGQIALMHQELVERRRWISERRFLHALNYCMLLPGPEAQQLATYLGWLMHRTPGAILAGGLFILPSLLLMIVLAWLYLRFGDLSVVAGVLYGVKPAVTAVVLHAAQRIGSRTLSNAWLWSIAVAAFLAIFVFRLPFPLIVLGAALLGLLGGRLNPLAFRPRPLAAGVASHAPALIDDHSPTPEHARFRPGPLLRLLLVSALLWLLPIAALSLAFGWSGTLTQIGWFFSKAALLSFGGAYAVLPYVHQGAVEHYGWLGATQIIDGLALGESTPGPLIMLVAFVGYIGAEGARLLGSDQLFLAGALGALVATWFTFLPSFVLILAGGPLVESSRDQLGFTAPLAGISAAVVGVILNLALFFAYHVFWPQGFSGSFEWPAALIAVGAAVALLYFRRGVIEVLAVSAAVGLLLQLF
jgi:chromate transporter